MRYVANDEFLAHYGVLGMKWGRRRTPEQLRSIGERKLSALDKKRNKLSSRHESANSERENQIREQESKVQKETDLKSSF